MNLRPLVAIVAGSVLFGWVAGSRMLAGKTFALDWPAGFGQGVRAHPENESATRLFATAERLGDVRDVRAALRDFLRRGGTPPAAVARFLDARGAAIGTLRAEIISNPPPVWALDVDDVLEPPQPPYALERQLVLVFAADALAQHARANEAGAWSDLHAAWIVTRSLWQRPEIGSVATAMVGTRILDAAAARLSPPLPSWRSEALRFELQPSLLRALEYEAWAMRERGERYPAGQPNGSEFEDAVRKIAAPLLRPVRGIQADLYSGKMRRLSIAVVHADPCAAFTLPAAPDWGAFIDRFQRLRCAHRRDSPR